MDCGADPTAATRMFSENIYRLDNDPYTIVGVLPAGFRHPGKTIAGDVEVWVTCGFSGDPYPKPARNMKVAREAIGRLKPGIDRDAGSGETDDNGQRTPN